MHYSFFCSWSKSQIDIMSNFVILTSNIINADVILEEWQGREAFHVLAGIQACKSKPKPDRSERPRYAASHAPRLEQMRKAMSMTTRNGSRVEIGDECIPDCQPCLGSLTNMCHVC